jgi:hypothetical protein
MTHLLAVRDELFVVVDDAGKATTFPESSAPDLVGILTTPALERRSDRVGDTIRELVVTLQPGDEGHAAASLRAAGFSVLERV